MDSTRGESSTARTSVAEDFHPVFPAARANAAPDGRLVFDPEGVRRDVAVPEAKANEAAPARARRGRSGRLGKGKSVWLRCHG